MKFLRTTALSNNLWLTESGKVRKSSNIVTAGQARYNSALIWRGK
jgi:hypothetical protein